MITLWTALALAGLEAALVEEAAPAPGDVPTLRVTWTNDRDVAVSVPSFLLGKGLSVAVERLLPGEPWSLVERTPPSGTLPADKVRWVEVAPGGQVRRDVPLSEVAAECTAGCMGGAYRVDLALQYPEVVGRRAGQLLPRDGVLFDFEVRGVPVDATADLALVVVSAARTEPTAADVVLRLANRGAAPVRVPAVPEWRCATSYAWEGATKGGGAGGGALVGRAWIVEDDTEVLAAGAFKDVRVRCPAIPAAAHDVRLTLSVQSPRPFYQTEPGPAPRVLVGAVEAPPTVIP